MPSRTRAAFTLVELLVVIGIIALLIGILLPSLAKSREKARVVACASNVHQLCLAQLLYAQDSKGWFMDISGSNHAYDNWRSATNTTATVFTTTPYRIHAGAMDILQHNYKLPEAAFFCPSNPEWRSIALNNTGYFDASTNTYIAGYIFPAGQVALDGTVKAFHAAGYSGADEAPDGTQHLFPAKSGQTAYYPILVADLTRADVNSLLSIKSGSNHIHVGVLNAGYMPRGSGGANVGYIDGHVDWHQQTQMGQTHPGVPQPSAGITSPANSGASYKAGYRQLYDTIYGYRYLF